MTDEIETDADGTNVDFLLRIIARGNRKLAKAESERDAALARVTEAQTAAANLYSALDALARDCHFRPPLAVIEALERGVPGTATSRGTIDPPLTPPDYPPEQPL